MKLLHGTTLVLCLLASALQAQTTMRVTEKSQAETDFPVEQIRKLTFAGGDMFVAEKNGEATEFTISRTRKITFNGTVTSLTEASAENSSRFALWPNPAAEQIQISFAGADQPEQLAVEILDINGSKVFAGHSANNAPLDISALPEGLYFCRISTARETKTLKFIRH